MMIEAGKLDRVVVFERREDAVLPSGTVQEAWVPFLTLRAEVRELRADEVATGIVEAQHDTKVIVTRWHPTEITTADRVVCAGRAYDIRQIVELGRRGGWKLTAVAA